MSNLPETFHMIDATDTLPTHQVTWQTSIRRSQFPEQEISNTQYGCRRFRTAGDEASVLKTDTIRLDLSIVSPARPASQGAMDYADGLFSREFPELSDLSDEEIDKVLREVRKGEE